MLPSGLPAPTPMAAAAGMAPRPPQRRQQQPSERGAPAARGRPSRGETRCIRVEHIPPHCASESAVRQFFNPFGKIAGVSVDKNACTAMVGFSFPAEAERALASPQPIFGNRFVRTYRSQEDPALFEPSAPADATAEDVSMEGGAAASAEGVVASTSAAPPATIRNGAPDAQALAAAKEAKAKAAAERARQLEANSARQKEVLGQLDGADKEQKRALLKEMRSLTEVAERLLREAKEAAAAPAGPEDARARLERLRREASALGLPGSAGANGYSSAKPYNRGEPKPKRFKLDFRSRRVLAEPVTEATAAELQSHLEKYGTVRALGPKDDTSTYSFEFDSREAAEQALAAVPFFVPFPGLADAIKSNSPIRTTARNCTIMPFHVGATFLVHNGKDYLPVHVTPAHVGHKLGEFSHTKKPARHA
ncbi:hypothetical protein JCM10908_002304 [Rhodotorula pacifica]|uniref:uncharacterized protein n=1 Tax=Rhodotorula pacifica TaxID=1495444 RepID=UPI0031782E7F